MTMANTYEFSISPVDRPRTNIQEGGLSDAVAELTYNIREVYDSMAAEAVCDDLEALTEETTNYWSREFDGLVYSIVEKRN
jgi:hypothetical protein